MIDMSLRGTLKKIMAKITITLIAFTFLVEGYTYYICPIFLQGDPVIPAFPDLHLAPASILKELAPYFQKVSAQVRQIGVPMPHELSPREASEYPPHFFLFSIFPCLNFTSVSCLATHIFVMGCAIVAVRPRKFADVSIPVWM